MGAVMVMGMIMVSPALGRQKIDFWLTVFHNNDGESQLINAGSGLEDFGGVARFATRLKWERFEALKGRRSGLMERGGKRGVVTLTSGDNFLAGPEFNASLTKGVPFYDIIALDLIGYDAMCLGNHDFDFGPDVLADFIGGSFQRTPFLSANLDFSAEPALQGLVDRGRIAASTVVRERGERIGVIGATTENLSFISSPRNVVVNEVLPAVQAEIDRLFNLGVNKLILISHLQDIGQDLDLISKLPAIDIAIAGGGDELLANDEEGNEDLLIPGEEEDIFGPYPLMATNADGAQVPVVTTNGNYKYVGKLVVGFDKKGEIVVIDHASSGPVRVAGGDNPDAVPPAPFVQALVVEPVQEAVAALAANVIGESEVALDGRRSQVRSVETNEGNLVADALLWQAKELADDFGVPEPDVALQNGGGVRNDDIRGPGDLTELDTFDILPFSNFVSVIENVSREQFKTLIENAVSRIDPPAEDGGTGRFAQVAGFSFTYDTGDTADTAYLEDADGMVTNPGSRVMEVMLDDGTMIVQDGGVVAGPDLTVATIDFLAQGGDQYPFRDGNGDTLPFTSIGVSYQQALSNYIQTALGGLVTAADYPEGGEGRIIAMDED
jgi:5'-nucleotidase